MTLEKFPPILYIKRSCILQYDTSINWACYKTIIAVHWNCYCSSNGNHCTCL